MNLVRIIHKLSAVQDTLVRNEALQDARNFVQGRPYKDLKNEEVDLEFRKLWQGLFYYFWLTDKEKPQEDAAESMASMIHLINDDMAALTWLSTFFDTLIATWIKLDKHRMSKYYLLVRLVFQQTFTFLDERKYQKQLSRKFLEILRKGPFSDDHGLLVSLRIHITDLFILELKQYGSDHITEKTLHKMLELFLTKLAYTHDTSLVRSITENVLEPLSYEKEQKLEDYVDDEEKNEKDELVVLPVNYKLLCDTLSTLGQDKKCKNREVCYAWKKLFESKYLTSADDILEQQEKELQELEQSTKKQLPEQKPKKQNKKQEEKKQNKKQEEVIDIITPSARKLTDPDADSEDDEGWEDVDEGDWFDAVDDDEQDDEDADLLSYDNIDLYDDDDEEDDDQDGDYGEDEELINMEALRKRIRLSQKKKLFRQKLDDMLMYQDTVPEDDVVEAIHKAVAPMDVKVTTKSEVTPKETTPSDDTEKIARRRGVVFSLDNNKVKLFEKTHVVEKTPISESSPKKSLLKKRLASEVEKPKNPPLVPQNLKKKRKK